MTSSAPRHGSAHFPGTSVLNDYVLGAELHRSGLGTLQLGWRHSELPHGRPFVIRRLHAEHAGDAELCSLVTREVEVARAVQSRNLLGVVAGSASHETPFSVMEYVEGLSIEQLMMYGGDTVERARLLVPAIVDALAGLSALHEARDAQGGERALTHQAPTPRHILVGLDGVARLTDFTQCAGPGIPSTAATVYRLRPEEMAPEQALSPEHVDPRCDVFIAAGTLWNVLTGAPLFGDDVPEQALQKMLRMQIPSLADAKIKVGPRLDRLIWQALVRTRRERLQSAAEFAELLRLYAQQAGLYASRDEVAEFVRTLWEKQAVEEPLPVPQPAAVPVARLTAARPTLVGLAPLPADVRAQLQSAVNPIDESAKRARDTEPRVVYPPLDPGPVAQAPAVAAPLTPSTPVPFAPAPPLQGSSLAAPPAEGVRLPTSAGLPADQRRSLPRVARELERSRFTPSGGMPSRAELPPARGPTRVEGEARRDADDDTGELTWRAQQRPVQAAPSTPAPAGTGRPGARADVGSRAMPYADYQLTQDYVHSSVGQRTSDLASAPPITSFDDEADDLKTYGRSPLRGLITGVSVIALLAAAAYGFRTLMAGDTGTVADQPTTSPPPASLPAAVAAPAVPDDDLALSAEPAAPEAPELVPPEAPSALPPSGNSEKPAAPAGAVHTRAQVNSVEVSADGALGERKPGPRAKKRPSAVAPEANPVRESPTPAAGVRKKSSATPNDENLPFNPYD